MKTLILFDVDGTLTESRQRIQNDMIETLKNLSKLENVDIGIVGGSDLEKQKEQLGDNIFEIFEWVFSENGLMAFKQGKLFHQQSFIQHLGEEKYKELVNFSLRYIAALDIPKKRGTFIECRNGMINLCPIGRTCSQEERMEFFEFDKVNKVREKMVSEFEEKFKEFNLKFSIGGQISIDVFPIGWDKTYCLQHVKNEGYDEIHFFGDKTEKGGNDFEIYEHDSTIGHKVETYTDTIKILNDIFLG